MNPRRTLLPVLLLGLPCAAQSPIFWSPDPASGRLEISGPTGGWTAGDPDVRIRVEVPGDPRPARDPGEDLWDYWERMREARKAAILARVKELLPGERPSDWARIGLLEWPEREVDPEALPAASPHLLAFLARFAQARAQVQKELEKAEGARRRTVRLWFNGRAEAEEVEVNRDWRPDLRSVAGENRLEVRDEATGQTLVRTWWKEGRGGPRLQVRARGEWTTLKILEPGGKVDRTYDFRRGSPRPGTYTVQWGDYQATHHSWWGEGDDTPHEIVVDVILDGGTDRERRLVLRRTCLPGAGEAVLGTFDVED